MAEALQVTGTDEIWEFGAGSGALALQLLQALGQRVRRYTIVDLSGSLARAPAAAAGRPAAHRVEWASELPQAMRGVVVGNEVLDAMPVKLLARIGGRWHERGVVLRDTGEPDEHGGLAWEDRLTDLRPPVEIAGTHDYLTEIHPQAEAFVRTLADRLVQGAAFFIDYGFPEAEYYHPQRDMGTLMCHRGHMADGDPLADLGRKDITAHVNFTGLALAAQEAGLPTLGYTTPGALPAELRPAAAAGAGRPGRARGRAAPDRRARDGRAVQGHRLPARRILGCAGFSRGRPDPHALNASTLRGMIRWIIVIFLALMLISWFSPLLQRMGFGKLPGDFRFKAVRARMVHSADHHRSC